MACILIMYWTICIDQPCDYLVMNSVNNLKKALMYLQRYLHIHCYLDNDLAGQKTVETIAGLYGERVSNEAVRYSEYKDLNDRSAAAKVSIREKSQLLPAANSSS